jgi:hypothetical protein
LLSAVAPVADSSLDCPQYGRIEVQADSNKAGRRAYILEIASLTWEEQACLLVFMQQSI